MRWNDRNKKNKTHLHTLMDLDDGHQWMLKPLGKKH